MLNMSQANEKRFIEWLETRLKRVQLVQMYGNLKLLNTLCRQKKIFETSLIMITDSKELKRVKIKVIDENALAVRKKKVLEFSQLLNFYEIFLEEDRLKIDGEKNVAGNPNQDIKENNLSQNSHITKQVLLFQRWLFDKIGMAERSSRSYALAINSISEIAQKNLGMEKSLYEVCDYDEAKHLVDILYKDSKFMELNARGHNRFTAALAKFLQFLELGDYRQCDEKKEQVEEWEGLETKLLEADLDGISTQKLSMDIGKSVYQIRKYLKNRPYAVAMPEDIFIHVDCIIDLHENTAKILKILSAQFEKFAGYTNDEMIYAAAKITMVMFLNDNAIDTPKKFYAIARYLFQKIGALHYSFVFEADKHIWEKQLAYPLSNAGVLLGYIEYCGGRITKEECISYLKNVKLPSGNINGLLSMGTNPQVLFYGEKEYVLAKKVVIGETWLNNVRKLLQALFKEQSYVVLREIGDNWFSRLPTLDDGLDWNILLLQDLIKKYFPEFRLIVANENQGLDTIRAGFVQEDSIIESFADLVYARILEDSLITLPKRIKTEELRQKLISYGMIQGNELIYVMPQALNDMRFAWNSEGNSVLIRLVNS